MSKIKKREKKRSKKPMKKRKKAEKKINKEIEKGIKKKIKKNHEENVKQANMYKAFFEYLLKADANPNPRKLENGREAGQNFDVTDFLNYLEIYSKRFGDNKHVKLRFKNYENC